MKPTVLVAAILCSVVLAQPPQPPPEVRQIMDDCRKEFSIDENTFRNHEPLPADKKCFHKCVAVKMGMMDASGNLQPAVFKAKLQSQNAPQGMIDSVDRCSASSKMADPCDTAEAMAKCMHPPM